MAAQIVTKSGEINLARPRTKQQPNGSEVVFAGISGPSSYTTGGEAITASEFGLTSLLGVVTLSGVGQYEVQFDADSMKLSWYINAVEVGSTADIDAIVCQVMAFGS
jgi:hypothetical protein